MTYQNYEGFYPPGLPGRPGSPPRQPLEARSSSVSSTSSSASYSVPYDIAATHNVGISRTVSPASGVSDLETDPVLYSRNQFSTIAQEHTPASGVSGSGAGAVIYSRNHYQTLGHEHQSPFRSHATPLPSQLLQAQATSSHPFYSAFQAPRQILPLPPYSGYSVGALHPQSTSLHQQPTSLDHQSSSLYHQPSSLHHQPSSLHYQPSPLHYESWPQDCAPTPYHSLPTPPSHQLPPQNQPRARSATPDDTPPLLRFLQQLSPAIILQIQEEVTWFHCWKLYRTNRWFRHNFHPDRLPEHLKIGGLLSAEKNEGREDPEESDTPRTTKPRKNFNFFGCYHCHRFRGYEYFESQKYGMLATQGDGRDGGGAEREQSYTPPPSKSSSLSPPANPHYDPSLTRSSLRASAAAKGRRTSTSPAGDASTSHARARKTSAERRFCVDCGLRKEFYKPRDVIDLHRPLNKGNALWVCDCRKLRHRLTEGKCYDCDATVPYSVLVAR
ncbi:hypothetical protein F5144DRAFT_70316 [Chaetomium tenue]|uniref:Uncharacterized protein n=1 Tax=Chaetomium tenue TaxID=1854479 RepID=A0ACB7PTM8_9PEZI|nr:hypothetical protein F5144DRAFT_70316 [Chaetomium globosum]